MGLTYLVCMVFLVPVFIATGEVDSVPMTMAIFAGVVCSLAGIGLIYLSWISIQLINGKMIPTLMNKDE